MNTDYEIKDDFKGEGTNISNIDEISKILIIYSIVFFLKIVIIWGVKKLNIDSNRGEKTTRSKESNSISREIEKLRKEAEIYNNPQSYVKYVKLEREIAKLQKQLDASRNKENEENSNFKMPKLAYLKLFIDAIFYFSHIFILYYIRGIYLKINKARYYDNNILFNYYNDPSDNEIKIPVQIIILLEGFFLHKVSQIISEY